VKPLARVVSLLRHGLHRRAYDLHRNGHREAALTLWAIVEELDDLLTHLTDRRRP